MPLRDHSHPDLSFVQPGSLYGGWGTMIVGRLNRDLPSEYLALPHFHWGRSVETDVATFLGVARGPALLDEEGADRALAPAWPWPPSC